MLRALASLKRDRTPGTVALYAAILLCALAIACVPMCHGMQDQLARAHHGRPSSTASWIAVQVVPKMYSFSHQVLQSDAQIEDPSWHRSLWINHYPIRVVRFETVRPPARDTYVLLRSGYQSRRWTSSFVVHVRDGELVVEDTTP